MFLVVALENVDDLLEIFLCHNVLHSNSNKAQKELNQNMFRITVDYLGGNLTSIVEINVLLNRRPMCVYFINQWRFNVYGSSHYSSKFFLTLVSLWCPYAGTNGKIT